MKSQVLHTVWCHISGEAAGETWYWSLLREKIVHISKGWYNRQYLPLKKHLHGFYGLLWCLVIPNLHQKPRLHPVLCRLPRSLQSRARSRISLAPVSQLLREKKGTACSLPKALHLRFRLWRPTCVRWRLKSRKLAILNKSYFRPW